MSETERELLTCSLHKLCSVIASHKDTRSVETFRDELLHESQMESWLTMARRKHFAQDMRDHKVFPMRFSAAGVILSKEQREKYPSCRFAFMIAIGCCVGSTCLVWSVDELLESAWVASACRKEIQTRNWQTDDTEDCWLCCETLPNVLTDMIVELSDPFKCGHCICADCFLNNGKALKECGVCRARRKKIVY